MVDFAALNEKMKLKRAMQGPEYPYAEEDKEVFDGQKLHTGPLNVTAQYSYDPYALELCAVAFDHQNRLFEVVATGVRSEDFHHGLGRELRDLVETAFLVNDFRDRTQHHIRAELTGFWRTRHGRDADGTPFTRFQLVVAEWRYEMLERGVKRTRTEGRLPSDNYATLTQAAPAAA